MCCLYFEGACGINWGIEKCQPCRIIARIEPGKGKGKGQPRTGPEGTREK